MNETYKFRRIFLIVLDSVGMGELPDARLFGDEDSDTIGHIADAVGGLYLPNMERLGLGKLSLFFGISPKTPVEGCYGYMAERSMNKDTTSGHWEMMGVTVSEPFPVYPDGFPPEIMEPFEKAIGRKTLVNKPYSGTKLLEDYGEMHLKTGYPLVYTSADSVFQIAAHEEIIPVPELYRICSIARNLLTGQHAVSRVIARPFIGKPGAFTRTPRRRDFSLEPIGKTVLDYLVEKDILVTGFGKIYDIFAGRGVTNKIHTENNTDGIKKLIKYISKPSIKPEFIFVNLVDFDMVYGHRNNPLGYANALEEFDRGLEKILNYISEDDLLIVTADHGCDPTTPSTDHSREFVPLLVYSPLAKNSNYLGVRLGFSDIAQTIADNFLINYNVGTSFLNVFLGKTKA